MADVVLEVRGGTLIQIYASLPDARFVIVDWDNIQHGGVGACWVEAAPLALMPKDTSSEFRNAVVLQATTQTASRRP